MRLSELAGLEWNEVDIANKLVRISASRMKSRRVHLVPLSTYSLNILELCQKNRTNSIYVFPSMRTHERPIGSEALLAGLRRLGIGKEELSMHGWRHTASTILHEKDWSSDAIERQLAHVDQNKIRGVYNQAEYLEYARKDYAMVVLPLFETSLKSITLTFV